MLFHGRFHNIWQYFKNKELDEIYVSSFLKFLAIAFISVFIPIYLYSNGFSIRSIMLFFLVEYITLGVFLIIGMDISARFKVGIKTFMAIGSFLLLIAYHSLHLLSAVHYLITAFLFGLSEGLYWAGFHVEFSKFSLKNKEGKEYAFFKLLTTLSYFIAPFLGAYIITNDSYYSLIITSSIFVFLSIIPLFFSKDHYVNYEPLKLNKVLHADTKDKFLTYLAHSVISISAGIIWPLFIYITIKNIMFLGKLVSLTAIFNTLLIIFIAKLIDSKQRIMFKSAILTYAPLWIIRIFFLQPIFIIIINFLSNALRKTIDISIAKTMYHEANKNILSYLSFREIAYIVGRLIILGLMILLNNFELIFIITGLISLFSLRLLKDKNVT